MYIISSAERGRERNVTIKRSSKRYRVYSQIMDEMLQISVKMQLSGDFAPVSLTYGKKGVRCP